MDYSFRQTGVLHIALLHQKVAKKGLQLPGITVQIIQLNTVTLKKTFKIMARKTDEELKQELQALQRKFDENVQEQRNIQDRAVAINAILVDRQEETAEKKSIAK